MCGITFALIVISGGVLCPLFLMYGETVLGDEEDGGYLSSDMQDE